MKNILILSLLFIGIMATKAQHVADYDVVPLPKERKVVAGRYLPLTALNAICHDGSDIMRRNAEFLAEYVEEKTGLKLPVTTNAKGCKVVFEWDEYGNLGELGAYSVTVSRSGVKVMANSSGMFYAIQMLRKALPMAAADSVLLPYATIDDEPRFSYRGMHLDVARHFFDVDFVKQYIDMLALHQINRFHLHLTDDQGWRWQVKQFPRLTEVGAYRNRTVIGRNTGLFDYQRYGGYFTQEQLKEIVEYASERYITVIPEIDMPGHMEAALAAYPNLGCTGGPYEVEDEWGVFDDILCAGKEETFDFVERVLDELIEVFPSKYIHIGGDEAPRTRWKECPRCQERIRQLGLKDDGKRTAEDLLQGYFMKRVENYLNSKGRDVIGWDELLDCGVSQSATIMSWRGHEGGIEAARKGNNVIMVPTATSYYDYYQTPEDDYWNKPLLIGGYVPLDKVYAFEPVPDSLPMNVKRNIIGLQANLWTEYITAPELAQYQALPRMAALAELQWTQPELKDYDDFRRRMACLTQIYRKKGWKYCSYSLPDGL